MNSKILFVDDESNVLDAYQRNLRKHFSIDTALSGDLGLKFMAQRGPYAVVVADMQMPGMNGVEFLTLAQQRAPNSVRLMLTGNADQKTAAKMNSTKITATRFFSSLDNFPTAKMTAKNTAAIATIA